MPSCVPLGGGVPKERAPARYGPEREQHSPERRMLGIVFVLAAVEQLDNRPPGAPARPRCWNTRASCPPRCAHARRMISVNASRPAAAERAAAECASDLRSERVPQHDGLLALRSR